MQSQAEQGIWSPSHEMQQAAIQQEVHFLKLDDHSERRPRSYHPYYPQHHHWDRDHYGTTESCSYSSSEDCSDADHDFAVPRDTDSDSNRDGDDQYGDDLCYEQATSSALASMVLTEPPSLQFAIIPHTAGAVFVQAEHTRELQYSTVAPVQGTLPNLPPQTHPTSPLPLRNDVSPQSAVSPTVVQAFPDIPPSPACPRALENSHLDGSTTTPLLPLLPSSTSSSQILGYQEKTSALQQDLDQTVSRTPESALIIYTPTAVNSVPIGDIARSASVNGEAKEGVQLSSNSNGKSSSPHRLICTVQNSQSTLTTTTCIAAVK